MAENVRITSVRFRNYKAFKDFAISFDKFNVMVGPNNAGKSTVLGALRILSVAIRRGKSKNPELTYDAKGLETKGYPINLTGLPVSTENIFHNHDDSRPATIDFRLSNGNLLTLLFRDSGECFMIPVSDRPVRSTSDFKRECGIDVGFVPILGPVEHNEPLYEKEAAKAALLSAGASRNFRNIWFHFPDGFDEFRRTIQQTWPGMDIERPNVTHSSARPLLHMFCPEERLPREIFWAGFGFQVWCQMLTFILQARNASVLVIDEPDIYLHSDLQRQLIGLLEDLGPQIVVATHSAEIISEVEPQSLLNINKKFNSARHVKDSRELQELFLLLGSNLNPTLTQLAKTRRVLFVEGKDFQIFSRFARKIGLESVANRADFAVIPVHGFNPQKVKDFALGMEATLGAKLLKFAIFDRDYRCDAEVEKITADLEKFCWHAIVHDRKEIENFLLHLQALTKAITKRINERRRVTPSSPAFHEDVTSILTKITNSFKNQVQARVISSRQGYEKAARSSADAVTVSEEAMNAFDKSWESLEDRLKLVHGKEVFSALNGYLQKTYSISLSTASVVESFSKDEIWPALVGLLERIEAFRKQPVPEQSVLDFRPAEPD